MTTLRVRLLLAIVAVLVVLAGHTGAAWAEAAPAPALERAGDGTGPTASPGRWAWERPLVVAGVQEDIEGSPPPPQPGQPGYGPPPAAPPPSAPGVPPGLTPEAMRAKGRSRAGIGIAFTIVGSIMFVAGLAVIPLEEDMLAPGVAVAVVGGLLVAVGVPFWLNGNQWIRRAAAVEAQRRMAMDPLYERRFADLARSHQPRNALVLGHRFHF